MPVIDLLGGAQRVKSKIEAYSYHEINTDDIKSKIENRMTSNKDVFGRFFAFKIDEQNLPEYLIKNKQKYILLFK